jgi:hypothetical protein
MDAARTFKPNDSEHVQWLQELFALKSDFSKTSEVLDKNPMGLKLRGVDLPMIHMAVASKYAEAVMTGQAYVPKTPSE